MVTLVVQGTTSGVNSTVYAICDNISNGTSFTFSGTTVSMSSYMTVNGQTFYGVSCGSTVSVCQSSCHLLASLSVGLPVCLLVCLLTHLPASSSQLPACLFSFLSESVPPLPLPSPDLCTALEYLGKSVRHLGVLACAQLLSIKVFLCFIGQACFQDEYDQLSRQIFRIVYDWLPTSFGWLAAQTDLQDGQWPVSETYLTPETHTEDIRSSSRKSPSNPLYSSMTSQQLNRKSSFQTSETGSWTNPHRPFSRSSRIEYMHLIDLN